MAQMYADPMGFSWLPNNSFNCANRQMGNMIAYQYGQSLYQNAMNGASPSYFGFLNQNNVTNQMNNEYAGDIDKNQDTSKGKAFDTASDSNFTEISIASAESSDKYKNDLSELGKSYGALIDSNKDGKVSQKEFVDHELSKLDSNATEAQKQEATYLAMNAFNKVDTNKDGVVDWKELSSVFATFDTSSTDKNSLDGKIDKKDFDNWSILMKSSSTNDFDTAMQKNYRSLFKDSK